MCGIFGIIGKEKKTDIKKVRSAITDLFLLSESRGKEASGIVIRSEDEIQILKSSIPASKLLKSTLWKKIFENLNNRPPLAMLGHARLATNGAFELNSNNQPVVKDGIIGIHNGIITNDQLLFKKHQLQKVFDVDTEVILSLFRKFLVQKKDLTIACQTTFKEIEGAASIGFIFDDLDICLLATNTGSTYYTTTDNLFIFASEKYFLEKLMPKSFKIEQLKPNTGLIVDLRTLKKQFFNFKKLTKILPYYLGQKVKIKDFSNYQQATAQSLNNNHKIPTDILENVKKSLKIINSLKRCTKCLLPETMPFIEFDQKGVCNYCHNYKKMKVKGIDALKKVLDYDRKDESNCLMTFSGGRDSSFGLHYFKKVLKTNPIAYSYDWGMIADLGRRNQARMTGKLGIEHILISADIKRKRENIRKNVEAWLRRPDLGTIPLFMAGDKQFFYYANKLGKRIGASSIIFCINPLEKTDFKFGFCGVRPNVNVLYRLKFINKIKMALYYLKQYILNPFYINNSLFDTLFAFLSYYFIPHNYIDFYQFKRWNEKEINRTLINEYNWETVKDTKTTWRIGDGTAPFYNYIYLIMAGFTENDTFRSNQIREGDISRQTALELIEKDNKIRYESIKWYCDTIGIDFIEALRTINAAPKRY